MHAEVKNHKHERLKIFHVLFSRGFAGSERSTAESCSQQCEQHDVTLVISNKHRRGDQSIIDHVDPRVRIIEISKTWFTKRNLRKLIERFQPDVIHCHLRRATRLVASIAPSGATVSTLHIKVNGRGFYKMDGLICNARWQVEDIENTYRGQVLKAHNSLLFHNRITPERSIELKNELGAAGGDYLIGAVGRYHPSKGWDTLIKAFRKVQTDSSVKLKFFGAGSQEAELKRLASGDKRIEFVGFRKDIKDLYQVFDLVVCPSRFEPLPRVMLEAMDGGAPVLASDEGGCKELIEDYGGFMFPVDNVEELAKQLSLCIAQKPPRHRPELSAHEVSNANAEILDFYTQCIDAKKNNR